MGFVAYSTPNYDAALTSSGVSPGPVVTQMFASLPLYYRVSLCIVSSFGEVHRHIGQRHDEFGSWRRG
jgi:hypothetical protein